MNSTGFYSTLPAQSDEMCFDIFEDEIFSSLTKDEKMMSFMHANSRSHDERVRMPQKIQMLHRMPRFSTIKSE